MGNQTSVRSTKSKSHKQVTSDYDTKSVSKKGENDEKKPVLGFEISQRITIGDFKYVNTLFKDKYGPVLTVQKLEDYTTYAMKVIKKHKLPKRRGIQHTKERQILSHFNNPFIVSLKYCFQTDPKFFMVLDPFNGVELFSYLSKDKPFTEDRSKFYGGEICLALKEIHSKGIIYTDLKPENIILDYSGHIKITDYNFSKNSIKGDTIVHIMCGKLEYLAPEVVQQQKYGKSVDWWSFGAILYQMMTGLIPFYNENLNVMYETILHGSIVLPEYLSKEAKAIILGLLERNPNKRLGNGVKDAMEIEENPFFKNINFDKMYKQEMTPPFIPNITHN